MTPDASAPAPDAKRQEVIDSSIQEKIHAELSKLRKQEQDMQKKIELALEKENIERQGKPWFGKDKGQSSELLQQELNRVKEQIEKFNKRSIDSFPALKKAREDIIQCYRYVDVILTLATTRSGRWTAGARLMPLKRPSPMRKRSSLPRGSNGGSRTFVFANCMHAAMPGAICLSRGVRMVRRVCTCLRKGRLHRASVRSVSREEGIQSVVDDDRLDERGRGHGTYRMLPSFPRLHSILWAF